MTDNELTARIGRMLFGWDDKDCKVIDHLYELYPYATDPKWIGPILIAAAGKGIMAGIDPTANPCDPRWLVVVTVADDGNPATRFHSECCKSDADLPRTLCRAILAAAGEEANDAKV